MYKTTCAVRNFSRDKAGISLFSGGDKTYLDSCTMQVLKKNVFSSDPPPLHTPPPDPPMY